jgi:hypothetical protein
MIPRTAASGNAAALIGKLANFRADNGTLSHWRNQRKVLGSAAMARCIVSFLDIDGMRHTAEVEAESLYEAVCLAVRTFRQHDCAPGRLSEIEVEIRSSVTHTVKLYKIHEWLQGGAKSPKEAISKERLRGLIGL